MNKLLILVLCWAAVTTTLAEKPSWYPDNEEEIIKSCMKESNYTPDLLLISSPELHAYYLCCAKGFNIYSEDSGLNIDRLAYTFDSSTIQLDCKNSLVKNCADQFKEITSKGEMILEVVKCITYKKNKDGHYC